MIEYAIVVLLIALCLIELRLVILHKGNAKEIKELEKLHKEYIDVSRRIIEVYAKKDS